MAMLTESVLNHKRVTPGGHPLIKQEEKKRAATVQKHFESQQQETQPAAEKPVKGIAAGMLFQDRLTTRKANEQMQELRKPAAQKLKEAQGLYDSYIQSDEYKQNLGAAQKKALTDQWMTAAITGSSDTIMQPIEDQKEKQLRAMVDHYKSQVQQEESQRLMEADLQELATWEEADRAALQTYIQNQDADFAERMNPMTDSGFGTAMMGASGLIEKYGLEKVNQMAESLKRSQNAEAIQAADQAGREGANQGAMGALGSNAASIPAQAVGSLTGLFGYLQELGQRTGRYPTMDPSNIGNLLSVYAGAVRDETAGNIEENIGGVGGKVASLGYQGLMSMADSYARLAMGGGSLGAGALAASGSFSQTVSEASARGATPGQAALLGITKAGIEALSEKIPLDEVVKTAKGSGLGLKNAVIDAFAQAGVEITTEEISLFASVLAEAEIMREKSAYKDATLEDLMWEAAETAVVSGISGGASSAGASVVANVMAPAAPAANTQQNTGNAANTAAAEQVNADGDNLTATEKQLQEDTTPELTEKEKTDRAMEETAAQFAEEAPKAAPKQKTETEINLDRAMAETFGNEGNDTGSRGPELERLKAQEESLRGAAEAYAGAGDARTAAEVEAQRQEYGDRVRAVQTDEEARVGSLSDQDAPAEPEARYPGESSGQDPIRERSWEGVGSRKVKAYMAENPEVKPFLQREAQAMAEELTHTTKGERWYNEDVHYESGGEKGWGGTKRHTSEDIAELRDSGMSYEQIGKGLNDIIEDHGKENSAAAKRVEMQLNDRLRSGHKDFLSGKWVNPNQEYIQAVNEAEANRAAEGSFDALMEDADNYAPSAQDAEGGTQQADGSEVSTEDEQDTGDGLGAVGAAASRFEHKVKTSRVYGNTYKNAVDPEVRASGGDALQNDPRVAQYDTISEAESLHEAELRSETGRDRYAEYKYLLKKDGWTGADNDTAMKLLTAFRKEGKADRLRELARKQREMATQGGQLVQSFAKYSRSDATVAVMDAVKALDELQMDQVEKKRWKQPKKGMVGQPDNYSNTAAGDMAGLKQEKAVRSKRRLDKEAFQKWKDDVTKSILEIGNDIENVEEGDVASMRDIVRQLAQYRQTTAWAGYSSNLTKNADRILNKMDFDTAKTMAKSQLAMIPHDFRKRSTGEQVKAVRIQNMLSALTTFNRNLSGNATTGLMDAVSDSTGGQMMDAILAKFTGKRTVGADVKYAGEYLRAARDAADMASLCVELDLPMDTEAAYSTGKTRTFRANGNIVERFMSSYEKYLKYSLEVSDKFFEGGAKGAVSKSLADLGSKTGLTEEQIQGLAQKAGERRTFKEGRKLAQANTGLKEALNKIGTENFGAGDMLIPFAGVPGDVTQTGIDYSGAGLIEGLREAISIIKDAKNGKKIDPLRQRKAAADFGRGATGVLLMGVFTAAAAAGVIKVHNDEDKDKRALDQSQGLSGAQMNLDALLRGLSGKSTDWAVGDELVSIDFLEPFNSQMYIGSMMAEAESWGDAAKAPFRGILSAALDMPMMQTFSDMADMITSFTEVSEDGNMDAVWDAAGQLAGDTMTGFIPSWMRQAAQTIDPVYRDTSGENAWEKAGNQVLAAVPWASKLLPAKLDGLGNEQQRYDKVGEGILDNFVTPWDTTTLKEMTVNDKLRELSDSTGDDSIYPEYQAPRAITVDGEEVLIDGKEMTETYQKTYGDNINAMYSALMQQQGFNELPEDQQIDAFKKAKEYATKLAKASVSDYDEDLPEGDTAAMVQDIMYRTRKSGFNEALLDLADAWDEDADTAEAVAELDRVYQEFDNNVPNSEQAGFQKWAGGGIADYIALRKNGCDAQQAAELYRQFKEIDQQEDLSQTQKAETWASVLHHAKEKGDLKGPAVANLKKEMGYYITFQQEATKYNQMVGDGLTADNADMIAHLLDGITGTGKVDKETGEKKILNRDNWRAIAGSKLNDEQMDIAMKAYMDDYDPYAESPDKTELRYDYARQEIGLTAAEYVEVITVQQEGGTKEEKKAAWRELGYSAQEADLFYRLFAATGRTKIDVEEWAKELYE